MDQQKVSPHISWSGSSSESYLHYIQASLIQVQKEKVEVHYAGNYNAKVKNFNYQTTQQ